MPRQVAGPAGATKGALVCRGYCRWVLDSPRRGYESAAGGAQRTGLRPAKTPRHGGATGSIGHCGAAIRFAAVWRCHFNRYGWALLLLLVRDKFAIANAVQTGSARHPDGRECNQRIRYPASAMRHPPVLLGFTVADLHARKMHLRYEVHPAGAWLPSASHWICARLRIRPDGGKL